MTKPKCPSFDEIAFGQAVADIGRKNSAGATTCEIGEKLGRGTKWVREKIGALIRQGKISVGRKSITRIDGTIAMVPVYLFKK